VAEKKKLFLFFKRDIIRVINVLLEREREREREK